MPMPPEAPAVPPADATRVLLRVETARIAELCGIVEGYDDLALVRTLRPESGLLEMWVSPGREEEFRALIAALAEEGLPAGPGEEG